MKSLLVYLATAASAFFIGIAAASLFSGTLACSYGGLVNCGRAVKWTDGPPLLTAEDESYAVYAAVLNEGELRGKNFVIDDQTVAGVRFTMPKTYYRESLGLERETVSDYFARNAESHPLYHLGIAQGGHIFLSGREVFDHFDLASDGWDDFYARFPDADGVAYFSRVGFDAGRSQALVYVGYNCGMDCGAAKFVVLDKSHGQWVVREE